MPARDALCTRPCLGQTTCPFDGWLRVRQRNEPGGVTPRAEQQRDCEHALILPAARCGTEQTSFRGESTPCARPGLISFGAEMGSKLIGEGVETATEQATLQSLGVPYAQGYYLGRPAALPRI